MQVFPHEYRRALNELKAEGENAGIEKVMSSSELGNTFREECVDEKVMSSSSPTVRHHSKPFQPDLINLLLIAAGKKFKGQCHLTPVFTQSCFLLVAVGRGNVGKIT